MSSRLALPVSAAVQRTKTAIRARWLRERFRVRRVYFHAYT
ncbi:hypothetical protein DBV15_04299 [Temnothorax longispinosus]|uniref:Uncharacterized protein n=1 Tax=Temnothorax longispinosus TaxID=300112 RepID=A0A4S2KTJ9_9HYME|nr:hypothetical protein DBV15_04299 [Temnothorax longispinosus]